MSVPHYKDQEGNLKMVGLRYISGSASAGASIVISASVCVYLIQAQVRSQLLPTGGSFLW
jgi:hypothetical protein